MIKQFALATVLAAAPLAAVASDLSYTYVEGGYAKLHIDEDDLGSPEGDGGYLRGSFAVNPQIHLFGGVGRVSETFGLASIGFDAELEVDVTRSEFGVGYHQAMGERVDFVAELSYLRLDIDTEIEGFSEGADTKGGRASLGLRGNASERVEGWVKVGYLDGGDFEGDFVGTLGGQFKFNQTWGVVGEVEIIDDNTQYLAGVRASF